MRSVRVTTDLPLAAEAACELAQKPALFAYVVRPIFAARDLPDRFDDVSAGTETAARLWWLGVLPSWRHHLRVVEIGSRGLYTNERGGLVRAWNHRLTFEPLPDGGGCRYTDEVQLDAGPVTPLVWLFAQLLFRYRQARWRGLARVLAG
ncbi:SRPBCC family protein [Conexibacter woesei]|uniref:Polyketide cyclase/dehydrase n=1 Tax=Conexibacter woesei (strain DSM 14684 / CCUG 47730 / CIP 108061 / JCM 11494 / NBRC 100937 / ID131577) TaxID=469383 RepID=D3FB95_CONWI|nr:hypothetical protein [Conexibacter woesei]ADB53287.1 conserved hypothetical protein [Conexibacter woesei DSM 14684]